MRISLKFGVNGKFVGEGGVNLTKREPDVNSDYF